MYIYWVCTLNNSTNALKKGTKMIIKHIFLNRPSTGQMSLNHHLEVWYTNNLKDSDHQSNSLNQVTKKKKKF